MAAPSHWFTKIIQEGVAFDIHVNIIICPNLI